MTIQDILKTSFNGLRVNKSRSALTILGIVIGITAIILIMAVGQSASDLILNQIRGLGSTTIVVEAGREPQGPSDFAELFTDSLKQRDVDAIKNPSFVQGIKELTPEIIQVAPVTYENETIRTNILGASEVSAKVLDIYPSEGAFFTDEDIKQRASLAVIGSEVKRKLFGQSNAVGEKIKIKNKSFRVIGVLSPKGQVLFFNVDDMIIIPYTTGQKYIAGINYFNAIVIRAESEEIVPQVVQDIKKTLRENHEITDSSKDDFHVMTQQDAADRVKTVTGVLTTLLVAVAAISLLVGGIGIMNIMLVSVTERTREIGLRKAIGATNDDILIQFLTESIMLTGIGGMIGIVLGASLSLLTSLVLTKLVGLAWTFRFPIMAALLGISVSTFVGLIFGIYPAKQAAKKSPIEALRYE